MDGQLVLPLLRPAAVALFVTCQVLLGLYGLHRYHLIALRRRTPPSRPECAGRRGLPAVTVQLPVYNEVQVVERLIDAACGLEYPREMLEIQVLDDSTDRTTALARARVAWHRARGVRIALHHRSRRDGFKAGALRDGMRQATGEFFAVFDADFLPPTDFLQRVLPAFADPGVGMVQARWGHLNRNDSTLTELQAVFLDGHFLIEQGARFGNARFFNFNGTAGVWRRACVEEAGGWSAETLTEDLDLSYRAQLAGWRFRYCEDVVVPAELPVDVRDFKTQQRRWAKGSLQTARKTLPTLWGRRIPFAKKIEACFHLTSNLSYLLFLAAALLLPFTLPLVDRTASSLWGLLLLAGTGGVLFFFWETEWRAGRGGWRSLLRVVGALALGMGMSLAQARAVLEGLLLRGGAWERTPKHGVLANAVGRRSAPGSSAATDGLGELLLAAYFATALLWFVARSEWVPVPFLSLLVAGLTYVGVLSAARRPSAPAA